MLNRAGLPWLGDSSGQLMIKGDCGEPWKPVWRRLVKSSTLQQNCLPRYDFEAECHLSSQIFASSFARKSQARQKIRGASGIMVKSIGHSRAYFKRLESRARRADRGGEHRRHGTMRYSNALEAGGDYAQSCRCEIFYPCHPTQSGISRIEASPRSGPKLHRGSSWRYRPRP